MFPADRRPRFVVVDPMTYFPDQLGVVQRNIREHGFDPREVDFWIGPSKAIFPQLAGIGPALGCVFIDGDHSFRGVTYDLNWAKLLRSGGLLIFHDYYPNGSADVVRAVDRFLKRCPNYRQVSWVTSLLVLEKTGPSTTPEVTSIEVMRAAILTPLLRLRRSCRKRLKRLGLI
jgi:predicted O-methyltransferase YrrM